MAVAYRLLRYRREEERRLTYERNSQLAMMVGAFWSEKIKFPTYEPEEVQRRERPVLVKEVKQKRPGRATCESEMIQFARGS